MRGVPQSDNDKMQFPGFDFQSRTRVVSGAGSVDQVGELTRELGARNALLVTDAGIVAAGHAGRVQKNLQAAGLCVTMFDKARENPTTRCVDDCVAVAKAAGVDTIIGLGGGSSMDTAKGCNFILTNGRAPHSSRTKRRIKRWRASIRNAPRVSRFSIRRSPFHNRCASRLAPAL